MKRIKEHLEKIQKRAHHIIKKIEYLAPDRIAITPNDPKALEALLSRLFEAIPQYQEEGKYTLNPENLRPNEEGNYVIQITPEKKCYPEAVESTYRFTLHLSHILHNYVHRPHKKP